MARRQGSFLQHAARFLLLSLLMPRGSLIPVAIYSMIMMFNMANALNAYTQGGRSKPVKAEGDGDNYRIHNFAGGTYHDLKGSQVPGAYKLSPHDDPSRADYPMIMAKKALERNPTLAHNPYATAEANKESEELCRNTMRDFNGVKQLCTPDGDCHYELRRVVTCEIAGPGATNTSASALAEIARAEQPKMNGWASNGLRVPVELASSLFRFFSEVQRCVLANSFLGYGNGYGCEVLLSAPNPKGPNAPRLPYSFMSPAYAVPFDHTTGYSDEVPSGVAQMLSTAVTPGSAG